MNTLLFLLFTALNSYKPAPLAAQNVIYPKDYFISPLDIPLTLAGNFGEPRAGHFHAGLDLKTNGKEGLKVYALADGYVSRINVSGGGYGNALYITYPNGYTSVYGHLKQFAPRIEQVLREEQYKEEHFAVDIILKPNQIKVSKGEVVALSGNTGASGGAHLHFEIRDTAENIINPLLFGYVLADNIKPTIQALKFYPQDETKYEADGFRVKVLGLKGNYSVPGDVVKLNAKRIGVGINTFDGIDQGSLFIGVYNIKLFVDETLIYEYKMDRFSFPERRYIFSHIDYPVFAKEGSRSFHRCYTEPGNCFPGYLCRKDRGLIDLSDNKPHQLRFEIADFNGSPTILNLSVVYDASAIAFHKKELEFTNVFPNDQENTITKSDFHCTLPKGILFDTVFVNYKSLTSADPTILSKVHELANSTGQIYDYFNLSIKPINFPAELISKAVIVCKDQAGHIGTRGGKIDGEFITARVRDFGAYYVKVDNTPPRIAPVNIVPNRMMRPFKNIIFAIGDNLSGIQDFNTYIDGKWEVSDYDAKTSKVTHHLDPNLAHGEHVFKITAIDERKNTSSYSVKFRM